MLQQSKDTSLSLSKLLILLIGLGFFSCDSSESNLNDELTGKWDWKGVTGGLNGNQIPADSFGFSEHYIFKNSSDIDIYHNDTLKVKAKYQVEKPYNDPNSRLLSINSEQYIDTNYYGPVFPDISLYKYMIYFVTQDSLRLILQDCADCYDQILVREK
ncbi:MAG TPA: hypothetical protein VIX80_00785 [Candidatus Kapabacteria bacterium]